MTDTTKPKRKDYRLLRREQPALALVRARRIFDREVAAEAGIASFSMVWEMTHGMRRVSWPVLDALVRLLGVPPEQLFDADHLPRVQRPR
jgi:transcriptional regulator with XRE-family HTH domain